jgi:tetratricopeptide (TPR) repeat protein
MLNFNSEELQSSISKFERMLETNHLYFFDAQEFEDIIVHYLGFGENQLAKKALKMALEQHPSSHELMLLQSEVFILDEKYSAALELLDYIENLTPHDEEISLQRANIASKKNNHKDSIAHLHKALELSEDPLEIWNLLGMEHLLAEEYEDASYFFRNCISDNPQDYSSMYNLLYAYEQLNKIEDAITVLNEVLEVDPYSEVAWHQLGLVLAKKGRQKEALSAFDFAIISDDAFTGAYIEKGKLLEQMGRFNEALNNYEVVLNTNDPSAFVYQCIGRCHDSLGNKELALKFYLKAIHLEPSNEKSWLALIEFYLNHKRFEKAAFHFKRALEINSDAFLIWKKGIEVYKGLGQIDQVLEIYKNLHAQDRLDLPLAIDFIDLFLGQKEWEKAYLLTQEIYKSYPKNKVLKMRLGGCSLQLGKLQEANFFIDWKVLTVEEVKVLSKLFPAVKQFKKRDSV